MTFEALLDYVKNIPYGRNSNRVDFSLVITENKGTCSSKHAFLKDFAKKNNIEDVELILGIYKMNEKNTKIGTILQKYHLEYIPEAHCYLKINGAVVDVTSKDANFDILKKDLILEIIIEPYQVANDKIIIHQNFIRNWIEEEQIPFSFDEIWNIREQCIKILSQ